jgi:hypothetical protein
MAASPARDPAAPAPAGRLRDAARRHAPAIGLVAATLAATLVVTSAVADVSHRGWPHTAHTFIARPAGGVLRGTRRNDLLLGGPGSDTIYGGGGNDVIWGDQYPVPNNPTSQHDVLYGGPGNNWIYTSHGYNVVYTGPGNNHVFGYFGHGTIHCGSGHNIVTLSKRGAYRTPHCEIVRHGVP